jgi:hypothetical protein
MLPMLIPSTDAQRAEVLERVADGYESGRYGWAKSTLITLDARSYCAIGAINHELGIPDRVLMYHNESVRGNIYAIGHEVFGGIELKQRLHHINDRPGQTKEEMIELLKNRAKELRNRAGESA